MLYGLQFVPNHGIYRLHEVAGYFIEYGLNRSVFGHGCFPSWFSPVLVRCPTLKKQFRTVFREARKQKQAVRDSILHVWKCHGDVRKLCDDHKVKVEAWGFGPGELTTSLEVLFRTLYDETLDRVSFQQAVGTTLERHYKAFREMGQRVCPFCGLNNYRDRGSGSRASYDHYLPQAIYPFGAVNFGNLVPMCDECNEQPNKGATDILFRDKGRTKRRTFFIHTAQLAASKFGSNP